MNANPQDIPAPGDYFQLPTTAFFEAIPIAFGSLDLRELKTYLERLRSQGILDLRNYCKTHPTAIATMTERVKVNTVNNALINLFEADDLEALRSALQKTAISETSTTAYEILDAIAAGQTFFRSTTACQTLSGKRLSVLVNLSVLSDCFSTVLVGIEDVTLREEQAKDLARIQADFFNIVINNRSGIVILDSNGTVLFANPAAQALLGRTAQELQGAQLGLPLVAGSKTEIDIIRPEQGIGIAELTVSTSEWEGQPALLVMLHDVTDHKQAQTQAQYIARHDPLTGLPNRLLFFEQINQALARAKREQRSLALFFIDLDHFKEINDSCGHAIGDRLLQAAGGRLTACLRKSDSVARIGGDEFTVLIDKPKENLQSLCQIAKNIMAALSQPFSFNRHSVNVTTSIGISCYPHDGEDADQLMHGADMAMYKAKRQGRNAYEFFSAKLGARAQMAMGGENQLQQALEQGQLVLHYQPQVAIASGRIMGVEALLRWQHPERGLLMPENFLPALQDSPLLETISEWLLHTACGQAKIWQRTDRDPLPIAVKLVMRQMDSGQLANLFESSAHSLALAPDCLELEISEQTLLADSPESRATLQKLATAGVNITLDHFGTGPASLSCLTQFPVTAIKVDRSLVNKLPDDPHIAKMVGAMIAMAHAMNLIVIAQGVETPTQLRWLREHGCDRAQGYALARPLPAEAFTRLLWAEQPLC